MNKKIRKDHKTKRNKKIYDEYTNSDTSFNKLARKYKLTPQRIQAIVSNVRDKGLGITLQLSDPKDKREKLKVTAIEIRESGKEDLAIDLFKSIIKWDEHNKNIKGQVDAQGHLVICYHLMAERGKNAKVLLEKAKKLLDISLSLAIKNKLPKGTTAIIHSHLASNGIRLAEVTSKTDRKKVLNATLKHINRALEQVPGSAAHRAWFLQTKARVQYLLGDSVNAIDTLKEAENVLYEGYKDEIKYKDQARLKLHVWTSGIDLTYAAIYKDTGRKILAEHKLASVLGVKDPEKFLTQQKRKAKELLEDL